MVFYWKWHKQLFFWYFKKQTWHLAILSQFFIHLLNSKFCSWSIGWDLNFDEIVIFGQSINKAIKFYCQKYSVGVIEKGLEWFLFNMQINLYTQNIPRHLHGKWRTIWYSKEYIHRSNITFTHKYGSMLSGVLFQEIVPQ